MKRAALCALLLASPANAVALDLPPGATRAAEQGVPLDSYAVPVAPWSQGGIEALLAEGPLSVEAWQVSSGATTLQILAPLRAQLKGQGYDVLFECETDRCGGFDFRYEIEVLPEPEMHVDLGDFRFLSARRDVEGGTEFAMLLVSRTSSTAYVQVTMIGSEPAEDAPVLGTAPPAPAPAAAAPPAAGTSLGAIADQLESVGRAILGDLTFETGSSRLSDAEFASLVELAGYLRSHPERRVTLVGHTDAEGSLAGNIALSRARARAVAERLTGVHGIPAAQVEADGVGYLMPLASNLTAEGRAANRRVEVVLISTE